MTLVPEFTSSLLEQIDGMDSFAQEVFWGGVIAAMTVTELDNLSRALQTNKQTGDTHALRPHIHHRRQDLPAADPGNRRSSRDR